MNDVADWLDIGDAGLVFNLAVILLDSFLEENHVVRELKSLDCKNSLRGTLGKPIPPPQPCMDSKTPPISSTRRNAANL
jgi:hypothetical protein